MRKNEGRTIGLYFKVTPEELTLTENKMKKAKIPNKRAYLRKMAVDGYVISIEMGNIVELIKLLRSISNNVNQMARQMNSGGSVYSDEVNDICTKQDETNRLFGDILEQLSRLK